MGAMRLICLPFFLFIQSVRSFSRNSVVSFLGRGKKNPVTM